VGPVWSAGRPWLVEWGGCMRMIGIRSTEGLDPFEVTGILDEMSRLRQIAEGDTLFVPEEDPAVPILDAWARKRGTRVVKLTEGHALVEFVSSQVDFVPKGQPGFSHLGNGVEQTVFCLDLCPGSEA